MSISEPGVGDLLGRYRLLEVLGRGGMGTVFLARDDELERQVAIKVINPALAAEDEFRDRFRREAVVLSRMASAHVVAVFDHGEQDGAPYLVTQLVTGGDLLGLVRERGALEPSYALDLTTQVLAGLADAHAAGVVHRDIKPSNVLLRDDRRHAYLCDFGIASSPDAGITRTGVLVGSTAYMAPERHVGTTSADGGVASDLYAAGCLLWTLLTGSQPYVGTEAEVVTGHLRGPVPQLPGDDAGIDRLNAVLRRALAKDADRRYPSARAMRADLMAVQDVLPAGLVLDEVTAIRQPVELVPERRRRRGVLVGTLVALLVAAAVYVGSLLGGVTEVPALLTAEAGTTDATTGSAGSDPAAASTAARAGAAPTEAATYRDGGATGSGVGTVEEPGRLPADPGGAATAGSSPRAGTGGVPAKPKAKTKPGPRFQCWNGAKVATLGSCSLPTGKAGSTWVFPGWTKAPGCKQRYLRASGYVEGWYCTNKTADGSYEVLLVSRWATAAAGESFLWSQVAKGPSPTKGAWMVNNLRYGTFVQGTKDTTYRYGSRVYTHGTTNAWTFEAYANTWEKAAHLFRYIQVRRPTDFRGVPLN